MRKNKIKKRPLLFKVVVVIVLSIATVWLRLEIVSTSYQVGQTDQEISKLKLEKESLELRTGELRSPRKLEIIAKQKLKLAPPHSDQIIYMHSAPKQGVRP